MKKLKLTAVALVCAALSVNAAWQTGLKTVTLTGTTDIDKTSYAAAVTNIVLSPVQAGPARAAWGANTTYVYWGQIYLDGSTYNFAESIDDDCWLKIDGTVVLDDGKWDFTSVGSISRAAGWYDFEVRFQNGTGGAGPVDKDSWGTTSYGFGYNTRGYTGKVGAPTTPSPSIPATGHFSAMTTAQGSMITLRSSAIRLTCRCRAYSMARRAGSPLATSAPTRFRREPRPMRRVPAPPASAGNSIRSMLTPAPQPCGWKTPRTSANMSIPVFGQGWSGSGRCRIR